jgi:hypothetical protein
MIREVSSITIFFSVVLGFLVGSQAKCDDGSWIPCEPEPPKLCLKYTTYEQKDCIESDPRPEVDPERMRYLFNKNRNNRYSSHLPIKH